MDPLILFLLILFLLYLTEPVIEYGSTSPGTLLQLVAKGPQDLYLTGLPSYYPYSYYTPWGFFGPHPYRYYRPYYDRFYGYYW